MPLLVDGPPCTIDELVDQDSGLLDTAQNCGINVTAKIRLAAEEIKNEVQAWLDRPRPMVNWFSYDRIRIDQVVVTSTLQLWSAMHTLELVYRDGYFSQLVDRYQAKWIEFARLSREARNAFVTSGLGVVNEPIHVAAPPLLGTAAAPQQGGTFYASVAWVNAAAQVGEASVPSSLTVNDGNLMTVLAIDAPRNAVGFNVYAGTTLGALYQQNDVPVPPGVAYLWVLSSAKNSGTLAGAGQVPEFIKPLSRAILRG